MGTSQVKTIGTGSPSYQSVGLTVGLSLGLLVVFADDTGRRVGEGNAGEGRDHDWWRSLHDARSAEGRTVVLRDSWRMDAAKFLSLHRHWTIFE
ncbi:hypothetical protein KIN20_003661 [Parelaphostrongylus tenuis]|uniref:Uncharacterized protein n=1 Tax=Parelaphostrongylus tenuis TaxID=148309 RepID=A0AAD5QEK6_PARTN|nr:hypothetical protein KIN20_003661 [Parelaphostrongylus tenuis]